MAGLQKCTGCGVESDLEGFLDLRYKPTEGKNILLCPLCSFKAETRMLNGAMTAFARYGVIVGVIIYFVIPAKIPMTSVLNWLFVFAWYVPSTIAHELGHVVAAAISGVKTFSVELGSGLIVHEFKYGGISWKIRNRLVGGGGRVYSAPRNSKHYHLRETMVLLGGVTANAVLILISTRLFWVDEMLSSEVLEGLAPFHALMIMNGLLLVLSLWPLRGKSYNDVLLLWRLWRRKTPKPEKLRAYSQFREIQTLVADGKLCEAEAVVVKAREDQPENELFDFSMAIIRLEQRRYSESRTLLHELLPELKVASSLRMHVLNAIAFVNFLMQDPELLPEADDFSRQASESKNAIIEFRGTRAMVLLALGRDEDAVAILQHTYRVSDNKSSMAYHACGLGIVAGRKGKNAEKSVYFKLARKLDPRCLLLDRENTA